VPGATTSIHEKAGEQWMILLPKKFNKHVHYGWRLDPSELATAQEPEAPPEATWIPTPPGFRRSVGGRLEKHNFFLALAFSGALSNRRPTWDAYLAGCRTEDPRAARKPEREASPPPRASSGPAPII